MEDFLARIEARYQFPVPADFREFRRHGFCRVLASGEPAAGYLRVGEMEWLSLEEIAGFTFEPDQLPGFVPFATSGEGDYWCWQPAFTDRFGPRVVYCPHDCSAGDIFTPNFRFAIFRELLHTVAGWRLSAADVETLRAECLIALTALTAAPSFLPPEQSKVLAEICRRAVRHSRPPAIRPTDWYHLLTRDETDAIILHHLGEDFFEAETRWMKDPD